MMDMLIYSMLMEQFLLIDYAHNINRKKLSNNNERKNFIRGNILT